MKKRKILIAAPLLLALGLWGCSSFSSTSYKAEKSTSDLVYALMQAEASAHLNHQIDDATHAKVKAAYEAYQVAGVNYALAVEGYQRVKDSKNATDVASATALMNGAMADFSQAASNLLQLIKTKK